MKYKVLLSFAVAAATLVTGCVKETFPTNGATTEQVSASASALAGSVNAVPAQMVQWYLVYGEQDWEFDMAYPGMMIIRDSVTGEIVDVGETGYDWFSYWSGCNYALGPNTSRAYVPWRTYYMFVKSANDIIAAVDPETASAAQLVYLGGAKAFRALFYLDMVRMYEYKAPTDPAVDAAYKPEKDVTGLAVPIVTEKTTQEDAKNNPRATVEDVYKLIFSDLDDAEKYLAGQPSATSLSPTPAVVAGLKARAYLERGSAGVPGAFDSAYKYADAALTAFNGKPLTKELWQNPKTGFNNAEANKTSWMWYIGYSDSNLSNLCNFNGHMSPECTWTSYAWAVMRGIPKYLYESIPESDFRRYSFLDPDMLDYYDYETNRPIDDPDKKPMKPYTNIKFRPAQGNCDTYKVGGASDVPLMRMEEITLIKAEAQAMKGDLDGAKTTLATFVKTRNPEYDCSSISSAAAFQDEVYLQKRIELWGEGLIYFDAKRLAKGMRNGYPNTNAQVGYRFNCTGVVPHWNFCIPQSEIEGNPALKDWNNPEPAKSLKEWTE
ncbi:MAG: RagB/SusD family nutrient uptake outer membrane protein [Bacteroidales bacterium]|nr:RagB/SusD family nutrient uptake outer membrane protein [Bacteroidales bacterium]